MAGISDLPFRTVCERMGAAYSVSEMITSQTHLWSTRKSKQRLVQNGTRLKVLQIAGSEPAQMAEAARQCEAIGAEIVDINMGCPAKKVCNRAAGSALLRDEINVERILHSVVGAVSVPVTLKIRTGWSPQERNAVQIAQIAEKAGIQALTVHGRTRACRFHGQAEYDTIAAIVNNVSIPVIANGDIDSAEKAQKVMDHTGATAVMIGRAARGNPWLLTQIQQAFEQQNAKEIRLQDIEQTMLQHLQGLHAFYGESMGVKIARKHIGWYVEAQNKRFEKYVKDEKFTSQNLPKEMKAQFNQLTTALEQLNTVRVFFDRLYQLEDQAA